MESQKIKGIVEDYANKKYMLERLYDRLILLSGTDPEQEMAISERIDRYELLFEKVEEVLFDDELLSLKQQATLAFRIEKMSLKEIAEIFGCTDANIRKQLGQIYMLIAEK